MKWVTRERPKTDRIACRRLTRWFIDSDSAGLGLLTTGRGGRPVEDDVHRLLERATIVYIAHYG